MKTPVFIIQKIVHLYFALLEYVYNSSFIFLYLLFSFYFFFAFSVNSFYHKFSFFLFFFILLSVLLLKISVHSLNKKVKFLFVLEKKINSDPIKQGFSSFLAFLFSILPSLSHCTGNNTRKRKASSSEPEEVASKKGTSTTETEESGIGTLMVSTVFTEGIPNCVGKVIRGIIKDKSSSAVAVAKIRSSERIAAHTAKNKLETTSTNPALISEGRERAFTADMKAEKAIGLVEKNASEPILKLPLPKVTEESLPLTEILP